MEDNSGSAFPVTVNCARFGLTKREWFAGIALMGFCCNPTSGAWSLEITADVAKRQADAMLAALNGSEQCPNKE